MQTGPGKGDAARPAPEDAGAISGFTLAPGTTLVPTAFSEVGYNTNPSQAAASPKGSGFVRSGGGFNLTSVSKSTVASIDAGGSVLDYFSNPVLGDPVRYAGYARANVTYLVQPGVTVSTGGFIDYDGQSINKNQSSGANIELGYRDALVTGMVRGRFTDVQYFNNDRLPASPVLQSSAFNFNRSELSWSGLLGNSWLVAPYAQLTAARVDYTDQPSPASLNRSADDYYAKTGLRLTFSPTVTADAGWRFNQRNTDDHRVTSFNSNAFDGSLTWRPSPVFFVSAYTERYIGEPSTNPAVLADVRSYALKMTYLPVPGVTVNAAGGWQSVLDIGSGVHYQAPFAELRAAWDYNTHVQFYTAVRYQGYDIDWQSFQYDETRVVAGVRVIPDGQNLLRGESLDSLFARLSDYARPVVRSSRCPEDIPGLACLT